MGTTHKVNNLLIQMRDDPSSITTPLPPSSVYERKKRRSFKIQDKENQPLILLSGKRKDPANLKFPVNPLRDLLFADREKSNFIWTLLRRHFSPRQIIPSWTGFNIVIQDGVLVVKSSIEYLNCIDSPATETSTIYQVHLFSNFCRPLCLKRFGKFVMKTDKLIKFDSPKIMFVIIRNQDNCFFFLGSMSST